MTSAHTDTTWAQEDTRSNGWDEAEYYEQGTVVTLTGPDGRTVTVARIGDSRAEMTPSHPINDEDTIILTTPDDFREHFPDGNLPDSEEPEHGAATYNLHNNGWFAVLDADGDEISDDVSFSLAEAIADAERILTEN